MQIEQVVSQICQAFLDCHTPKQVRRSNAWDIFYWALSNEALDTGVIIENQEKIKQGIARFMEMPELPIEFTAVHDMAFRLWAAFKLANDAKVAEAATCFHVLAWAHEHPAFSSFSFMSLSNPELRALMEKLNELAEVEGNEQG